MDESKLRWEVGTARSDPDAKVHWLGDKFSFAVASKVGTTPRERLRWLACEFGEETTVLELAVFILFEAGPGAVNLGVSPPLSVKRLATLIKEVRKGLEHFVDGKTWELNVNQRLVCRLSRQVREFPPDKGKIEVRSTWSGRSSDAATFRTLFLLAVRDLLVREGERLGRCEFHECQQGLFVKEDGRQRYCSESHATRDRQYRYRTGHAVGEVK
jgi:hypothetical protein